MQDPTDRPPVESRAGGRAVDRRRYLAGLAAAGSVGLAGCAGLDVPFAGDQELTPGQIGSGRTGRAPPGGTSMAELPDLSGTLTVYSGRGEFLVGQLMDAIRRRYDGFDLRDRYDDAVSLTNQIRTEGQNSPADVFFTVNSGVLGLLTADGRTQTLSDDVLSMGREGFQDPDGHWIGTSGRVRAVPYNTDVYDASDIPEDVFAFPETGRFENQMGWAPTYSSFQGFVTAMRVLNGRSETRQWLTGMVDHGVAEYSDEFRVAQAVANGEISAGLTNHYYIVRVKDARPDAPIEMGFTKNDAGSFFNVAGAAVLDTAGDRSLAANFIRHLLSAEAQDYFARTQTFEYPMIPEVEPIEELPGFDELQPPDIDLAKFATADVTKTIDLLEETNVL